MPRPKRSRRICEFPDVLEFSPDDREADGSVVLTLEEYQTIRLVDLQKMTHEQCAKQMDISRTTVTEIYESARAKIADCIVNGRRLLIAGGNYRLCSGREQCPMHQCAVSDIGPLLPDVSLKEKGDCMRVAVTYENGQVFQHFGHTENFKVYDIEDGKVTASQVVNTNGQGHGALAGCLQMMQADAMICGGIGPGAQMALDQMGIKLYAGVQGDADVAVQQLLDGTLVYSAYSNCNHDGHDHDHACPSHDMCHPRQ